VVEVEPPTVDDVVAPATVVVEAVEDGRTVVDDDESEPEVVDP
jgi:hypothetical protein